MITDKVRLIRKIGEGGMGSVWQAHHLGLEADVAVKFMSAERATSNPRLLKRFKREAAVAAKIRSPHAVQVFDHGVTDDDIPYIVMELLSGVSLADRLALKTRLSLRETVHIVTQTAQVLSAAHKLGIVHRDIKPDNLFLIESEYEVFVKVLDFGIAKRSEADHSVTGTGEVIGTPEYLSPEQLLGKEDSFHADLWALTVVAYRALTGLAPFKGKTLAALSMTIVDAKFEAPSALVESLPKQLDMWFARALHKDCSKRFSSARELASSFGGLVSDVISLSEDDDGVDSLDLSALSASGALPRASGVPESLRDASAKGMAVAPTVAVVTPLPATESAELETPLPNTFTQPTPLASSVMHPHVVRGMDSRGRLVVMLAAAVAAGAVVAYALIPNESSPPRDEVQAGAPVAVSTTASSVAPPTSSPPDVAPASDETAAPVQLEPTATSSAATRAEPLGHEAPKQVIVRPPPMRTSLPTSTQTATTAPPPPPAVDCSKPTYIDKDGVERFRRECLK